MPKIGHIEKFGTSLPLCHKQESKFDRKAEAFSNWCDIAQTQKFNLDLQDREIDSSQLLLGPGSILLFRRLACCSQILRPSSNIQAPEYDHAFFVGTNNKAYYQKLGLKEHQLTFAPHAIDNKRFAEDQLADAR